MNRNINTDQNPDSRTRYSIEFHDYFIRNGDIVNNIAYMDKKKILGDISTKNKYYLGKKLFFYKL